jgi:potassium-transporting ATPase potassium-binding subunit
MTADLVAAAVTFAAVGLAAWPLGIHMARVYQGQRTFLHPVLGRFERLTYRLTGVHPGAEQTWIAYLASALALGVVSAVLSYAVLRLQGLLPLNPQRLAGVAPDLSFNTAVSFMTNTSWQNYAGEQTLSYLSQMLAIGVQGFLSGAMGMALAVALIRGLARRQARTLGNFWVDLTRSIVYVLLPLSVVGALVLASQGVVQNLNPYTAAHTLQGGLQVIAQGPAASWEPIKDMSGDGGGLFNANSGHPFENPNGFTNQLEMLLMLLVPFALTVTMGRMVGSMRQGLAIGTAMAVILIGATVAAIHQEQTGNPALTRAGATQQSTSRMAGGNMEGKSVRFGPILSAQFAAASTGSGDGAVDSSHDSMTPLGGLVPLVLMKLGEISPGGPGAGLYGILILALQAVFIAGLMVGRTPEFLGKKIEQSEIRLAMLANLVVPFVVLGFAAVSILVPAGLSSISNPGPHGLSQVLYALASTGVNNGSAFAGLSGNTSYYNTVLGVAMWLGRFSVAIPVLALAGSLAAKRRVPAGAGTFRTDTSLFIVLLVGVILIIGALTFFPALALSAILEQLHLNAGGLYG